MEALIEILFQILLELLVGLLQVAGELLLSLLGEGVAHAFERVWGALQGKASPRPDAPKGGSRRWFAAPWWPVLAHGAAGLVAGCVSLWWMPELVVRSETLRMANVLITPLAAGTLMGLWGSWRRRRGLPVVRVDAFATAYCFAFCMAAVRFFGGV